MPDSGRRRSGASPGVRKMAERWWIYVCPECNGLLYPAQTHNETCPYRDGVTMFVARAVEVVPA